VLLWNGQVLVAGGEDNSYCALTSAELYNGPAPPLVPLFLPVIVK